MLPSEPKYYKYLSYGHLWFLSLSSPPPPLPDLFPPLPDLHSSQRHNSAPGFSQWKLLGQCQSQGKRCPPTVRPVTVLERGHSCQMRRTDILSCFPRGVPNVFGLTNIKYISRWSSDLPYIFPKYKNSHATVQIFKLKEKKNEKTKKSKIIVN